MSKAKHRKSKSKMSEIPLPGNKQWNTTLGYSDETPLHGKPDPSYSLQGERTIGEIKENIQKVAQVLHDDYHEICYDLLAMTAPSSSVRKQWNGDDLTRMFGAFFMRNMVKDALMDKHALTLKSGSVARILKELDNLGTVSFQEDILPRLEKARQKYQELVQSTDKKTLKELERLVEKLKD